MNFRQSVFKDISKKGSVNYAKFTYENVYAIRNFERALAKAALEKPLKERRNIKDLTPDDGETKTLKAAIEKSISLGEYQKFVTFHSQYMLDIHTMLGDRKPNQRFLPWHRVYLAKFEEMLNTVMKKDTGKDYNIAIPYWDWEHDHHVPEFLKDLTPTMDIEVYLYDQTTHRPLGSQIFTVTVKRFPGTARDDSGRIINLPTEQQINEIRSDTTYLTFSDELEGDPHGRVHNWVGGENPNGDPNIPFDLAGPMAYLDISPANPCFWCHHANVDRIWAGWQKKLEEEGHISQNIYPDLNEAEGPKSSPRMTPWYPEYTEPQTRKIEMMGYTYDKFK